MALDLASFLADGGGDDWGSWLGGGGGDIWQSPSFDPIQFILQSLQWPTTGQTITNNNPGLPTSRSGPEVFNNPNVGRVNGPTLSSDPRQIATPNNGPSITNNLPSGTGGGSNTSVGGPLGLSALLAGMGGGPRLGPQPADPNALPGMQRNQQMAAGGAGQNPNLFGVGNPNPNGLLDLHGFLNSLLGQGTQY